jgi:glycerate kinase
MILVAPTDFKGTISARAAAQAMARGARYSTPAVVELPLSDGGPGLIDALEQPADRIELVTVSGPLNAPVQARVLRQRATAIIESADACGLHLVPANGRDPWHATTRGVGELIAHAARTADTVVVGLGGSATIDAGIGMAAALGWRFVDDQGRDIPAFANELANIQRVQRPGSNLPARIVGLTDVHTPLCGPGGAAQVFGPQKGLARADVPGLDAAFDHLAGVIERDLHVAVRVLPGSGAAGGLGAGLRAFLNAELASGSEWLLAQVGFNQLLARADLLITGEGSFDAQSMLGKITGTVIERAAAHSVPVLLIAGRVAGRLPDHVQTVGSQQQLLSTTDLERAAREGCARLLRA